jgi:alkylation response protein AidB-like acyl-CoA dehydrogenase
MNQHPVRHPALFEALSSCETQSIPPDLPEIAAQNFDDVVDWLKGSGLLDQSDWRENAQALRRVAQANLSLGRLLEGHVNARQLIETYGDIGLRRQCLSAMREGALFGVWGADGPEPVTCDGDELSGSKRFTSGLGHVDRAIVSAKAGKGQQLFVVEGSDPARQDRATWSMAGMQESQSGQFDCTGVEGQPLGARDIYTREPLFLGGTWRIAAVTLGGTVGLLERTAETLHTRGQAEAEAHLLRLSPVTGRVLAAWPAILDAAAFATGPKGQADPEAAAIRSLSTRLLTEELGQETIAAVERSIGLSMFAEDDPVGRMARDLACYMRQAARDAFSMKVGRALLSTEKPLGSWLDD